MLAVLLEGHRAAGRERAAHLRGAGRLDADDAGVGPQRLHRGGHAREQAAAADGHVHLVHVGAVLDDLQARRCPGPR